jgi:hypothetical protein
MDRGIEKSGIDIGRIPERASIFDALAVASVLVVLAGASLSMFQASWRIRAYFSTAAVIFDILLAYEFLTRLIARREPVPWLDGISSVLPLLAVSGPFIFGWLAFDFRSAAVRGFWLADAPVNGLAFIAALRMLRVLRFSRGTDHELPRERLKIRSAWTAAASTGMLVVIAGALASDALLLPGIARLAIDRRASMATTILAAEGDAALHAAARAAGVLALELDGRALIAAPAYVNPAEYQTYAVGDARFWFPVAEEVRARGLAATVAALASLAAVFAFRIASAGPAFGSYRGLGGWNGRNRSQGQPGSPKQRFRDAPTGDEELAGILGKRPR